MVHKFLKMGGFSSVEDLYDKYPNEEDFFNDYPEARQMAKGGNVVSEDWKAITGTDWSQAKKLGLTDNSYEANVALHKRLLNGEINLNTKSKPSIPLLPAHTQHTNIKKDYIAPVKEIEPDVVVKPSSISSQREKMKSKAVAKPNVPMKVYSDPSLAPFQGPTFGASPAYMPLSMGRQPAQPFDEEASASAHMPNTGIIVDKRTGMAYYKGHKGQKGSFPVMTGVNVNLNSNPYSLEFLEKHPEFKNTPVGNYLLETPDIDKPYIKTMSLEGEGPGSYYDYLMKDYHGKMRALKPISAYGSRSPIADQIAFHRVYADNADNPNDPEYLKRVRKLKSGDPLQKCGSYGCANVLDENYDEVNAAFPTADTLQVIDSSRPGDLAKLMLMKKRTGQKRDGGQTDDYGIPTEEADRLRATSQINFTQPTYFQSGGPLSDNRYMYEQGGINEYGWGGSSNGPLGYFQDGGEQETTDDTYNNDLIYQQYMDALQNNNALYDSFNSALLNEGQDQQDQTAEDDTELRYGGIDNSNMKPQFATGGITNYGAFSPVMQDGGFKPDKDLVHKMAKEQFGLNTPAPAPVPTITSITDGKRDFFTKYLSEKIAKSMANSVHKEHQDMMNQGIDPNMDPNMGQGMQQMPQDMEQAYAEFGGSMSENLGQSQFAYGGFLPENDAFWNNQVGDVFYPGSAPSYTFNPKSTAQQPLTNALGNSQPTNQGIPPYAGQPNQMIQNPFGDPNERADVLTTQTNTSKPFTLNKPYNPYANALKPFDVTKGTDPFASKQRTQDVTQPFDKDADRGHRFRKAMGLEENFLDEAKKVKEPSWFKSHAGDIGRGIVAGEEWLNARIGAGQDRRNEKEAISRGKYSGDRGFITVPETASSHGNYAMNGQAEGVLRPNQYVLSPFYLGHNAGDIDQNNGSYYSSHAKYGGTSHKKNTELYMTEDELEKFLKAGGQVEYLD